MTNKEKAKEADTYVDTDGTGYVMMYCDEHTFCCTNTDTGEDYYIEYEDANGTFYRLEEIK